MTVEEKHKVYLKQMSDKGASKPYMNLKEFKVAFNIQDNYEIIPVFIARKSASHKQVLPTLENHLKKCKDPKRKNLWGVKKAA